jgi:hypothetical protein
MRWPERPGRAVATATVTLQAAVAAAATLTALVIAMAIPAVVLAASPTPSQEGVGDPRSSGQGPGLVGDPLAAIVVVAAIGVLAVAATLLYVRLTAPRDPRRQR